MEKMGALTWIVGGDFNTAPGRTALRQGKDDSIRCRAGFQLGLAGSPMSSRITMPTDFRYPPAAFDQIFYRGATLSRAWVAPTSPQSSDHRAVSATLSLP